MSAQEAAGVRTYYALLLTETVSLIGSLISAVAVGIAVFQRTGQATPLALVEFFQILPLLALGGVAGALADRFDRRLVMLAANVGFVVCSGLLLALFASGALQLWRLYALSFASAAFGALARPAFRASVATLVPAGRRDRANGLGQLTGPVARVIAPAAAGLLYALIGVVGAIALDICSFAVAIAVLLTVRIPRPSQSAEGRRYAGSVWRQAFDGFRYLGARPALLGFCGYSALVAFLINGVLVVGTPYLLDRAGGRAVVVGLVFSALNMGAVAGALVMSLWSGTRPRIHTILPAAAASGLFLALAGAARTAPALALAFFLFELTLPIGNAATLSMFQAKVAPDLQGRVFAATGQISAVLAPLGYLAAGPLADRVFEPARRLALWRMVSWAVGAGSGAGIGLMLMIGGALTCAVALAVYASPAMRRLEAGLPDHEAAGPLELDGFTATRPEA